MRVKTLRSLIAILVLVSVQVCMAQPGDPNGGGAPGAVPISGIEILLAIGAILGVKSLFPSKKSNLTKD